MLHILLTRFQQLAYDSSLDHYKLRTSGGTRHSWASIFSMIPLAVMAFCPSIYQGIYVAQHMMIQLRWLVLGVGVGCRLDMN